MRKKKIMPVQMDLNLGRRRRDSGAKRVTSKDPVFQEHAFGIIVMLAESGATFTADDVASRLKIKPRHPNCVGGVFLKAKKAGILVEVALTQAKRANQHATRLMVYRGAL